MFVAKVISKDVPLYLDEIGTCAAYETVQVQAQVSGQIIARHFQDGADVKKGDLLFTIDPRPYQAALDQAKAQAALDQMTLKRQEELRARKVILAAGLRHGCGERAKVAGRGRGCSGESRLLLHQIADQRTRGSAPRRCWQHGHWQPRAAAPCCSQFRVSIRFTPISPWPRPILALVRKYLGGPNVKVQTYSPDDKIPPRLGDLYFIDTAVQPGSGTVKARGVTPNPDHAFWPSEFVRVRFILDTIKDARLVPSQAVQISQSGPFIFVLKPDNTVDLRPVKPGQRQDGDLMVVESGVQPGETVVVTGQLALAAGNKG